MIKLIGIFVLSINAICYGKGMSKITSGRTIDIREYPHHVSIQFLGSHMCGGSIISSYHVITAASCVILEPNVFTGNLKVLSGTHSSNSDYDSEAYFTNVKYIIYHPEYSLQLFWQHDIAILKLETPIILNDDTRKKVELETLNLLPGKKVKICGWRHDSIITSKHGCRLQHVGLEIKDILFCMEKFDNRITVSQKCATVTTEVAEITLGNSGGGIIRKRKLVGIISVLFGIKSKTIIFTQIYPFYNNWIEYIVSTY